MDKGALFSYYRNYCPFASIVNFATLDGTYPLSNREIVFRYGESIFKRYQHFETIQASEKYATEHGMKPSTQLPLCFNDCKELEERVRYCAPDSVSLGPIFPCSSLLTRDAERKNACLTKYAPIVFDVDTDKDTVRDCECEPRQVCDHCWPSVLRPAMLALNEYLTKVCNFKAVLFVFSGRRGFNCYVLDSIVWGWTRAQRSAILRRAPAFIVFDEAVTLDPMHLIKAPLVPHHATGVITAPIKDLATFLPSMGIHYSKIQSATLNEWCDWIHHVVRSAK